MHPYVAAVAHFKGLQRKRSTVRVGFMLDVAQHLQCALDERAMTLPQPIFEELVALTTQAVSAEMLKRLREASFPSSPVLVPALSQRASSRMLNGRMT